MKRYRSRSSWWTFLTWTAEAAALVLAALAPAGAPETFALVAVLAALLLLVHLRVRAASRAAACERERTLALLQQTLDSAEDGFLLLDLEGRVVSFNSKLAEMSGLPGSYLTGSNFEVLLAWLAERVVDPAAFLAVIERITAQTELESRDELRLRDGRIFERRTRPHYVGERLAGRVWSFRDVTSERTALDALHRREQQLAQAQSIARLGSFDWDVVLDRVQASDELWRIAGHEPEAFPWTFARYMDCIHPDDRQEVIDRIEATLGRGDPLSCDVRIVHPDGSLRHVHAAGFLVRDEAGAPARLIGTVQDVTERWRAAAALARSVRVEQALTQISTLLAEPGGVDSAAILRVLGVALAADRVYLLQSRQKGDRFAIDRAEEWCSEGVPALAVFNGQAFRQSTWPMRQLREHGGLLITRVDELPDAAWLLRSILSDRGVVSAAAVPVRDLRQGMNGLLAIDFGPGAHTASEEDLRALRTVGEMLVAHFARDRAERETAQRDEILEAVSFMAERFLLGSEWQRDLDHALERIGAAAKASRAYLFSTERAPDGEVRVSQRAEWVASGIVAELGNPDMQSVRLADMGLARWEEALQRNEPVQEMVRALSPEGRAHLEAQGIRSVLLIPIFVGEAWWGFLGFDDCENEREWSNAERDVLMAAGRMIGAGIQRQQSATEQKQLEEDLRRANRIEAIGHLAAGIAHEINTPIQYVGDNLRFLNESVAGIQAALEAYRELLEEARAGVVAPNRIAAVAAILEVADVEYLLREAPKASAQALDGVQRVAEIVRAMKEFSHPGTGMKVPTDLNQAIRSATTVARNEWKYVAELVTDLDETLPPVHCFPGELNQAILNLVVNAAHAIADRQKAEGSEAPGTITVATAASRDSVLIRVRDTGTGIPPEIRSRIFDPFFTTKEVGRGTGQGLTFVHSIVVDKHGGTVTFETELGAGTTFTVRLPVAGGLTDMGVAA